MVPEAKTSRHQHMVAIHRFSAPNGLHSVTQRLSTVGITQRPFHGRTKPSHGRARRRRPAGDAFMPWPWQRSSRNQIKASLSAFKRWEVKVLGFGVRARLRPQRMASRWCPDPFALVGAIGKACGEARRVLFSGSPPGCWCVLPLLSLVCWWGWCVGVVRVLTALMR